MKIFGLVSLAEEIFPAKATRINSRGPKSCLDTFLVSRWLLEGGRVSMYEVVDWIETGSDHCPIYLRVRVYPNWVKRSQLPTRQILKASGLQGLRKKLGNVGYRPTVVSDINLAFSSLNWFEAVDRADMDILWSKWVVAYEDLVEKHVGTHRARISTWGRKFDINVRALCKQASISRSWYILACEAKQDCESFFEVWAEDRRAFLAAWEKSNCD